MRKHLDQRRFKNVREASPAANNAARGSSCWQVSRIEWGSESGDDRQGNQRLEAYGNPVARHCNDAVEQCTLLAQRRDEQLHFWMVARTNMYERHEDCLKRL